MSHTNLAQKMLSLFKGRENVIAVATGAAAFAPEHGKPITAERLATDHLAGVRCLGFYLMLDSEHCVCSCLDFDNKPEQGRPDPSWRTKAESVFYMLTSLGLTPLMELSQSGEAAHVWIFFASPVPAWVPRAFWRRVCDRLEVRPIPEFYPRQDKLADANAIGNLVRFPLWALSRFVDPENDLAVLDPIEAVDAVRKVTAEDLRLAVFQSGMGELVPDRKTDLATIAVASAEGAGTVPARVAKLVSTSGTLLAKRWDNDPIGMQDRSRSAVAMSLCTELVRAYVPTPEIAAALWAWVRRHDREGKYHRDAWINLTVAKAYDFVMEKRETRSAAVTTLHEACHQYIDRIERGAQLYVPSGIADLDASIDGIAPGEVCILAGRPSHGKSAVAFQWVANAAGLGVKGLIISEEMGAVEIGRRRLQSISRIDADQWVAASCPALRRDVDDYHKGRADVYVVESCNSIDRVEEVIDQMCGLYNVGFVAIDYLQLLGGRSGGGGKSAESRQAEVAEVSRRVKQATRRNLCATLLLSQLNRGIESRDDFMPKMSDLRESGQIEQDADLIVFGVYPHRVNAERFAPDMYRLVCAKRRNGPTRQPLIETTFNPSRQIVGFEDVPPDIFDAPDND